MLQLQGQHILILGLGASGMAMARWCVRFGAEVVVADTRQTPPQLQALQHELPSVRFTGGALDASLVQGTTIRAVFVSPGLAPDVTAPVLDAARANGLWVGGELSLFAQALQDLQVERGYAPQVLAITGTNGKTTVTSLTGQLVARACKTVQVAGNIGPCLLDTLTAALDGALPEVWVLELSSFQLENAGLFEATAATVLNLSQDHLDWHGSMAAYAQAKARIFGDKALMVLNRDDAAVMAMLPEPVRVKLQKPMLRSRVTPSCCHRHVPALTCSKTMSTAPRSLAKRWPHGLKRLVWSWRCRHERSSAHHDEQTDDPMDQCLARADGGLDGGSTRG